MFVQNERELADAPMIDYTAESDNFKAQVEGLVDSRTSFKVNVPHDCSTKEVAGILVEIMKGRGIPYEEDSFDFGVDEKKDRYVIDWRFHIIRRIISALWLPEKTREMEENEARIREEEKCMAEKKESERKLNEALASMTSAQRLIYESIQTLSTRLGELDDRLDTLEGYVEEFKDR